MELGFWFHCQLAPLYNAPAVHVSTHSESLALKHSSIQWLWLPGMLWEWGMQVHLWLLVCDAIYRSSKHHNSIYSYNFSVWFCWRKLWSLHLVTSSYSVLTSKVLSSVSLYVSCSIFFFCIANRFNKQHLECDCWRWSSWSHGMSVSEWPTYLCQLHYSVWYWFNINESTKHRLIHWHQCQQPDSSTQYTTSG